MILPRRGLVVASLLLVFILSACAPSTPNELAAGKREFLQHRYQLSYVHIQKAAQAGDPDAQYALGYMYYYGKGVPQDMTQAQYWIHKSAANGQPLAIKASNELKGIKTPTPKTKPVVITPKRRPKLIHPRHKKMVKVSKHHPAHKRVVKVRKHRSMPKKVVAVRKKQTYTAVERHLLKSPSRFYTLQLLGSYSQRDVVRFIRAYHMKHKARYYRTVHNGKSWYVVIYGTYKNRMLAAKGLKQLPAKIRRSHPWMKRMSRVQFEIRKR